MVFAPQPGLPFEGGVDDASDDAADAGRCEERAEPECGVLVLDVGGDENAGAAEDASHDEQGQQDRGHPRDGKRSEPPAAASDVPAGPGGLAAGGGAGGAELVAAGGKQVEDGDRDEAGGCGLVGVPGAQEGNRDAGGERGKDESGFLQDGVRAVDRLELCFVGGQAPPGGTQRRVQRRAGQGRRDDQRESCPPGPDEFDAARDEPEEHGGRPAHEGEHAVGAEPVEEPAAQRGAEGDDEGVGAGDEGGSGVAVGVREGQEQGDGQHG